MTSDKLPRTIGIDLGGTKISFIDMFSPEKILGEKKIKTPQTRNELIGALIDTTRNILSSKKDPPPMGIGIAAAGQINHKAKSIVFSPHLPFKSEFALGAELEKALNVPVTMENDANAAAIGEKVFGQAKEMDDFIVLTLGTGIGSGIFTGGKLLRGYLGAGGEAGHIVIDPDGPQCNCGNRGCLEAFAGGVGIARMAEEIFGRQVDAEEVSSLARGGDEKAKEILKGAGQRLGDGLVSLVNVFNPQAIFFIGSLTNAPDDYFLPALKKVKESSFGTSGENVVIKNSIFKDSMGVIGAAALPVIYAA
ncbi:MAG: ROK family protein [Nitrospinota bacterium]